MTTGAHGNCPERPRNWGVRQFPLGSQGPGRPNAPAREGRQEANDRLQPLARESRSVVGSELLIGLSEATEPQERPQLL